VVGRFKWKGKNAEISAGAGSAITRCEIAGGAASTSSVVPTAGFGAISQARIEQSFPAEWPCASQLFLSF